ncbi:ferritin, heavy subunit [Myripristis murdjan]|uniref:Ferritin n=1 Tax=Myripristis murdjan TaxID=586833 RepID=A0A667YFH1_9TELE|nr:ferritin, heavy subunit-like [Myripristis murdjan]
MAEAEPGPKRFKSDLPRCPSHRGSAASRARQNLSAGVEEALCGVSSLLRDGAYRLQALAFVFEQGSIALPRLASFFHQQAERQEAEADAMLAYLAQRGGCYCARQIKRPGCEAVCAVFPALELLLLQLREEVSVLVELSRLAGEHGDPHAAGLVKRRFLQPRVQRVKLLGDLLASARRLGCTDQQANGFGEYLLDELQEELSSA